MLRPIPNLDDEQAMRKLGRLSALRSARLDALHELRDVASQMQGADETGELVKRGRVVLDRIEEIAALEKIVAA